MHSLTLTSLGSEGRALVTMVKKNTTTYSLTHDQSQLGESNEISDVTNNKM